MKVLYIEAKKKNLELSHDFSKLPKRIGLLYTIQFKPFIKDLKKSLEKAGKEVFFGKGTKVKYPGQVLGCDAGAAIYIIDKVDCFLFLSSGKWHAKRIALSLPKDKLLFMINPQGIERIKSGDLRKSQEVLQKKFYLGKKFGILVSTKLGQQNIKMAIEIKEKLEKIGKEALIFLSDNINSLEFENFKIDLWINTACPGITFDFKNVINISQLNDLEF